MTRTICPSLLLRERVSHRKAFFLCTLLIFSGCPRGGDDGLLLAGLASLLDSGPGSGVVAFQFQNLMGTEQPPLPMESLGRIEPFPASPGPEIFQRDGNTCLSLLPTALSRVESGLLLVYCSDGPEPVDALRGALQIESEEATAVQVIRGTRLEFSSTTWSRFRATLTDPIRVAFDGSPSHQYPSLFPDQKIKGELHLVSGIPDPDSLRIPFRFHTQKPHLILTDRECLLAIQGSDRSRIRLLRILDPEFARRAIQGFRRMAPLIRELEQWPAANPVLSEWRFGSKDTRDDFVELSTDRAGLVKIRLEPEDGGPGCQTWIYMDRTSSFLLRDGFCSDDHRISRTRVFLNDKEIPFINPTYGAESRIRSFRMGTDSSSTLSDCHRSGCDSAGIHPDLEPVFPGEDPCGLDDMTLSEINPWGFLDPYTNRRDPGGKYLELEFRRQCDTGKIAILDGNRFLDLPAGENARSQVLLLVADPSLFTEESVQGSQIRRLSIESRISLLDTGTGATRTLFELPEDTMIPTGTEGIHSLVFWDTGKFAFSLSPSPGVRSDWRNRFFGSPGIPDRLPTRVPCQLRFSEVAPAGTRSQKGSHPGDEYLELMTLPDWENPNEENGNGYGTQQIGICRLEIAPSTDDGKTAILFPPKTFDGRLLLVREAPVCFSLPGEGALLTRTPFLPNGPSQYRLLDGIAGTTMDRLYIDENLYQTLDDTRRRSLERTDDDHWVPSTGNGFSDACLPFTSGTPGQSSEYNPFPTFFPCDNSICTRIHSQDTTVESFEFQVLCYAGESETTIRENLQPDTDHLLSPCPTNRVIIRTTHLTGGETWWTEFHRNPPELLIQEVHDRPEEGRTWSGSLCSPTGFALSGRQLLLDDGQTLIRIRPPAPNQERISAGHCLALMVQGEDGSGIDSGTPVWTLDNAPELNYGEGFRILARGADFKLEVITSAGSPDSPAPFRLPSRAGGFIRRVPGTTYDNPASFEGGDL